MESTWFLAATWLALALTATLLPRWFGIFTAPSISERVLRDAHCPRLVVH